MTTDEKFEIQSLLDRAQSMIAVDRSPDGYNIGVNIGRAAGQKPNAHTRAFDPVIVVMLLIRAAEYDAFSQTNEPEHRGGLSCPRLRHPRTELIQ